MPVNSSMETTKLKAKKSKKGKIFFSKVKRKFLKHVWIARIALIIFVISAFYLLYLLLSFLFGSLGVNSYTKLVGDFILTPAQKIQTTEDRTNILILGRSGEGHDSPDLTDTIIFASVGHTDHSVKLISLPRDIWIPELRAKLNSTYYWGNQRQKGGGIILAKSTVESILGQPVHYGLVIDFSGFMKMVDVLGGVEIDVERAFVDEKYPIAGKENDECDGDLEYKCRYETVSFEKGKQIMDGETALKFVRSRNAEGDEGTDLAREARQQKVIAAVQKEVFSSRVLLSPKKMLSIWKVVSGSVETDIDSSAGAILLRRLLQAKGQMDSHVLPEDFLVNPPIQPKYDNLYVFIPAGDGWKEVHSWVRGILFGN
jgi:LCP family protein required for cell wall assembly